MKFTKSGGPVLDFEAYQRKVDFYTNEWNLPKKPVSDYYNFKYLKEALDELGLLHTWDRGWNSRIEGSSSKGKK
jgi:hypothetical protein